VSVRSAGIISARNNWNRRGAVRAAWADAAQVTTSALQQWRPAYRKAAPCMQDLPMRHAHASAASASSSSCGHHATGLLQVPGQSAVRFFVASQGPVDPPAGQLDLEKSADPHADHATKWMSRYRRHAGFAMASPLQAFDTEPADTTTCPAAAELKAQSDFVWLDVPKQQNYRTIGDSTLKVFQHVVATYDFSFVLKVGAAFLSAAGGPHCHTSAAAGVSRMLGTAYCCCPVAVCSVASILQERCCRAGAVCRRHRRRTTTAS
jgi:hypothetical protein